MYAGIQEELLDTINFVSAQLTDQVTALNNSGIHIQL